MALPCRNLAFGGRGNGHLGLHYSTPAEFLAANQPPMFITLYFIVTRLPDSLCSVMDHFLSLDPTSLSVDLLEQHLLAAETSAAAVGAARGTPRAPFFEGCSPSLLAPAYAFAAAADVPGAEDVGASASAKCRSGKGKGRKSGGGGSGSGVVVGAAVEVVEAVEVVAAVGVVAGMGVLVAAVEAAVGVAAAAAVGLVAVGLALDVEALVVASGSSSSVRERPRRPSSSTCGKLHTKHRCFSRLDDAWRAEFGDDVELPRWADLLRFRIAIFDLELDAILSAMYALSVSAEGDCYWCVLPDPGIAAAALGASKSGTLPSTAPAHALHTFTFDSGASRCFFRDSTTLTPLPAPVPVRLADSSEGPIVARSSTLLLCPAISSGSLSRLHLPSFSTNLVSTAALQDAMVTTTTPGGQRVSICTCTRTGRHLITFTRRPRSSLYTLATEPPQVAASAQVSASGQVATSCSCRLLSHQTLLWHYKLGHPSLPRLGGMLSRLLISGLPRSLPPLPPSPAPPCLPCVEGWQRAAPHSSFPPTTAPLQTLHMDVWGPARVNGQGRERYFLLVVDDYTRYTMVFPLRSKGEVVDVLIPWIRTVHLQLCERFGQDLPVLRLHFDKGAPHWLSHGGRSYLYDPCGSSPFSVAVCGPILGASAQPLAPCLLTGDLAHTALNGGGWRCVGVQVLPPHLTPCPPVSGRHVRRVGSLLPSLPLPLCPSPAPATFPCSQFPSCRPPPASGVSQVDPLPGTAPFEVAVGSGATPGAACGGAEPVGAGSEGAGSGGAEPGGDEPGGAKPKGVEPGGAESEGAESGGAEPRGAASSGGPAGALPRLSLRQLREWLVRRARLWSGAPGAGGTGDARARGAGVVLELVVLQVQRLLVLEVLVPGVLELPGLVVFGALELETLRSLEMLELEALALVEQGLEVLDLEELELGALAREAMELQELELLTLELESQPPLQPASPLPAPSPYTKRSGGLTERRELASHPVSPVRTARRAPRSRPPPILGTHAMALRPSSVPLHVPLSTPLESSLPEVPDPESERARAANPTVSRLLATAVTDPSFEFAAASSLVAELLDLAAACRLDYATALVAESASANPPSVRGECALRTDVLEDRQEDFECLAAAVPRFASMLLAREGDLAAPPTWLHWVVSYRTTLAALGFTPSTADPSLFLRNDTSLPMFYILMYVLQRFDFQFSSPQPTPLSTGHSLSAPPSDDMSGMGLVLGGRGPVVFTGHADASWVDDSATQWSSLGYTFSLASGSVSWWSTRSSSVLSSSCEAEIYAGAMAAEELRWLTYLLTDLGEQPRSSPHRGLLCLAYLATRANTADIFTKALSYGDHQRFSTMLGLVPSLPHLLTA
ncbi:unnamed protein product [Closterium sp. NIES-53]